jgi:PIN domain nuclease of toxin-antitoxin system
VKLLLDTHSIIWLALDRKRISDLVMDELSQAEEIYISFASAWEYGIKRLKRPKELVHSFGMLKADIPAVSIGIEFELFKYSELLPSIHSDPFDRILIAQALHHDLTLVTKDTEIQKYPVKTLW